ncbi:MAG TPA: hypothetical protein VNN73_15070 [Blastocatellia bacterium]|nr:hypothetical protein [Blastocatellia bacterium]
MSRKHNIALMFALLALVFAASGCNVINTLRAKDSVNEGVRQFNKGKYKEAEERFRFALDLNPDMMNAELYHAQAIYAQFKDMKADDPTLEQEFNRTLDAYKEILRKYKNNPQAIDQAYAFTTATYGYMSDMLQASDPDRAKQYEDEKFRLLKEWAELPTSSNQVKASAYYSLGYREWKQAYDISDEYQDLKVDDPDKIIKLREKIPADKLEQMRPHVEAARKYFEQAIQYMPDWNKAHSMLRLTIRQQIYLLDSAETPDTTARDALYQEYLKQGDLARSLEGSEQSALMNAK